MKKFFLIAVSLMLLGVGCQNEPVAQKIDEVSFQQREKCRELGSKYRKENEANRKRDEYTGRVYIFSDEPVFGYSLRRKTCLYVGESWEPDKNIEHKYVIDLLTNENVAGYSTDFNGEVDSGDKEAFNLEKARFKLELQDQFDTK